MFNLIKSKNVDYISNTNPPTFPDGFDLEIFKKKALDLAYKKAMGEYEKEHVTPYFKVDKIYSFVKSILSE